ncbi:hypothetical protein V6N12_035933 [Hibiscus sabdariffa]|uniref:Uncharacterized protein n=1 Tax=Hibiscus sabdariffa TaxID=183260 RepID=A0ABR2EQV8_9ROSI
MIGSSMESFFHGRRRSLEILIGLNYISMDLIVPLKVIVMAWVGVFLHTQEPSHVWKQKVPVSAMKPGESSIQGASLSEVQEVSRLVAQVAGHVDSGGWLRLIKGRLFMIMLFRLLVLVAGVGSADGLVLENDVVGSEGVTAVEQGDGRVVVAAIVLSHVLDSRQIARENVHSKTEDDVEFPSLQASV